MADAPVGRSPAPPTRPGATGTTTEHGGKRRVVGLDRSGPPPPQTVAGAPLRPLTVPNLIGFARLALIPVFLVLAYSAPHGRSAAAAAVFAVIAWSDYADGLAARLTGQYSRLGALLDPIVDRLLILAGGAVCWSFSLLPRWALVLLVVREVGMLVAGRVWLARGLDIRINWPGRAAVWPVMASVFWALVGLLTLGRVFLYLGLALALVASALYARSGWTSERRAAADRHSGGRHPSSST